MADGDENLPPQPSLAQAAAPAARRRGGALAQGVGVVALAMAIGWQFRESVVDRVVSGQLSSLGLAGSYRIAEVGAGHQVLTHVVLGDPAHPDFTADRVETQVGLRGWAPGFSRVTLVRPRLYGRWQGGRLSFGSLDRVIYAKSTAPFRLPDMELVVVDGRASLMTQQGAIGLALAGDGPLRGGFAGVLAAVALQPHAGGCTAQNARFHGMVRIAAKRPVLTGPLRLEAILCGKVALVLAKADINMTASADPAMDGGRLDLQLTTGKASAGSFVAQGLSGRAGLVVKPAHGQSQLTAGYSLAARSVVGLVGSASLLEVEGRLRGGGDLARLTADGTVAGTGLALTPADLARINHWQKAAAGTLAAPLLAQMGGALSREGAHTLLSGQYVAHRTDRGTSLVVPEAHVTGTGGQRLASLSRAALELAPGQALRLAGNLATEGQGLPHLRATMTSDSRGGQVVNLQMADYRAGTARLALPDVTLTVNSGGRLGFAGRVVASGALPGGDAANLVVPVDGGLDAKGGLALWQKCAPLGFDRLGFGELVLEHRAITICPVGPAIVTLRGGAAQVAARLPGLDLAGHMGTAPLHITGGAAQFGWSGAGENPFSAQKLVVTLGGGTPGVEATRIALGQVDGHIGAATQGHFTGAEVALAGVPLNVTNGTGQWRYDAGVLALGDTALALSDRETQARFNQLVARGASLRLEHGVITAAVGLREPASDRVVASAIIRHELGSGLGHADLAVPGITFDTHLQPDTLTPLALGIIANASGTIAGQGRIDWQPGRLTSTGRFATNGLDFAAAVGPLKGVAGTVEFTDLLGLVTAPDQHLRIGAINPGIEVDDGQMTYALLPGHVLAVAGAWWPFLDGRMELLPTRMVLGASEVRRYEIRIKGMNAAKFLQHMDMGNLSATGLFDGSLPMVFDENGGRIEGGVLASHAPGGSVSYVGELSYKDLSPMANYAFKALRSLQYREMRIAMDGAIAGQLVTRVEMKGVSQGKGAKRNFITNQLARLPIQFNVTLRAPFYQLITSFKSLYDPAYVRDPRELGLMGAAATADHLAPPTIQPPAREHLP